MAIASPAEDYDVGSTTDDMCRERLAADTSTFVAAEQRGSLGQPPEATRGSRSRP